MSGGLNLRVFLQTPRSPEKNPPLRHYPIRPGMQDYDVTLKNLLTKPGSLLLETVTGTRNIRWLNVETPKVRNTRRDLLGETANRSLIGIEIESRIRPRLGFRIGEYQFGTTVRYGRMPKHILLYIGPSRKPIPARYDDGENTLTWHVVDIRDLDGEALLASPNLGDNVVSVLTKLGNQPGTVRRIVERIASRPEDDERGEALAELTMLAGLRQLTDEVIQESRKMLSEREILKNAVFGPPYREGREKGFAEGEAKGEAKGVAKGRVEFLFDMLEKRFGLVPPDVRKRLHAMKSGELTDVGLRLMDAQRIEDLFV